MPRSSPSRFGSANEAKDFLVSRISEQALLEGVPLSEIEKKELYYSADAQSEDATEINAEFHHDFNQDKFEKKVTKLAYAAQARLSKQRPSESRAWSEAVRKLKRGDHYLLVMVGKSAPVRHPFIDLLRAVGTGLFLSAVGVTIIALLEERFLIFRTREGSDYVFWIISSTFVALYCIGWLLFGRNKMDAVVGAVIDPPLSLIYKVLEWAGLTQD